MFAFPRSFFLTKFRCVTQCLFFSSTTRCEKDYMIHFFSFFLFYSVLTIRRRLLPPRSTTRWSNQQSIRIASFFPFFFLSIRRLCSYDEAFIYIYIYRIMYVFSRHYSKWMTSNVHFKAADSFLYTRVYCLLTYDKHRRWYVDSLFYA